MSKKRNYVPPTAEMILLTPCEALAVDDWGFGDTWKTHWGTWGKFAQNGASGIIFGGTEFDGTDTTDNGFVIKTK